MCVLPFWILKAKYYEEIISIMYYYKAKYYE